MPRTEAEELAARYAEFEYCASLPLAERIERGFIETYRPGLSDGPPVRSWNTMAEYRQWCEENLEPWLGYCSPEKFRAALDALGEEDEGQTPPSAPPA